MFVRFGHSHANRTLHPAFSAPPDDFDVFASVCLHIIRHLNDGWDNGFRLGVRDFTVWNEPSSTIEVSSSRKESPDRVLFSWCIFITASSVNIANTPARSLESQTCCSLSVLVIYLSHRCKFFCSVTKCTVTLRVREVRLLGIDTRFSDFSVRFTSVWRPSAATPGRRGFFKI